MFQVLGKLSNAACRIINMVDHIAEAGEFQTQIIRDTSKFDAAKKRLKLDSDLQTFALEQQAKPKPKD